MGQKCFTRSNKDTLGKIDSLRTATCSQETEIMLELIGIPGGYYYYRGAGWFARMANKKIQNLHCSYSDILIT